MSKSLSKLRKRARAEGIAAADESIEEIAEILTSNPEHFVVGTDRVDETNEAEEAKGRKRKRKRKTAAVENESASVAPKKAVETVADVNLDKNAFVNSRTIYIEGLPFTATDTQVNEYFRDCGKILSIRLPRWHDSGRLRGYGHVEFATDDAAAKAFDLDGKDDESSHLNARFRNLLIFRMYFFINRL